MTTLNQTSESLLAEILVIVQDIHSNQSHFERRLTKAEERIAEVIGKLDRVLLDAFPDGAYRHGEWHKLRNKSIWKRFLLRLTE